MHHELAVIGAGSGSSIIDSRFEHLDVAVVERGRFVGTCLNSGCIPTKMYVSAADVARPSDGRADTGVDAEILGIRWRDIRDRSSGASAWSPVDVAVDPWGESWNLAACSVVVTEADGRSTALDGEPDRPDLPLLGSTGVFNGRLHDAVLELVDPSVRVQRPDGLTQPPAGASMRRGRPGRYDTRTLLNSTKSAIVHGGWPVS